MTQEHTTLNPTLQAEWEETLLSSFMAMVKAEDGDFAVLDRLSQATSDRASFNLMIDRLSRHPQGKIAFEKRLRLGNVDLDQLAKLPPGTLGQTYAQHMIQNQLKPLQSLPAETNGQFLAAHVTETHDIWHVITNSQTDVLGEIKLEAFSAAQLEVSRFWVSLLAKNLLKSVVYDIEAASSYLDALTQGWQMGKTAKPLFGVNWSDLWDMPLAEVRSLFNISI